MPVPDSLGVRSVVAQEDDRGVVGDAEPFQPGQHASDLTVGPGDLRGVVALALWPVLVGVRRVVGDLVGRVGCVVGEVEEERVAAMALDELQRFLGDQFRCVRDVGAVVLGELDALVVAPQVRRPVVVRVAVGGVAEVVIEALLIRVARAVGGVWSESPLADHPGRVPAGPHHLGHGHVIGCESGRRVEIGPDRRVTHVLAGQQRRPRRRADAVGVRLGEAHTLRSEVVDHRRLDHLLAIASELTPSQVVEQDDDHIRLAARAVRRRLWHSRKRGARRRRPRRRRCHRGHDDGSHRNVGAGSARGAPPGVVGHEIALTVVD